MSTKVGIFGGTFDPIHNGHLYIAYEALNQLKLDKIIFIPGGNPPHKSFSSVSDANQRYKMVELAIKSYENFEISDYELKKTTKSYSFETLEYYKSLSIGELYFILGADSLITIDSWKNVDRIMEAATLVVFNRPGFTKEQLVEKKAEVEHKYNKKIIYLDLLNLEISSSGVREEISTGKRVDFFIPDSVKRYIEENNIYR